MRAKHTQESPVEQQTCTFTVFVRDSGQPVRTYHTYDEAHEKALDYAAMFPNKCTVMCVTETHAYGKGTKTLLRMGQVE